MSNQGAGISYPSTTPQPSVKTSREFGALAAALAAAQGEITNAEMDGLNPHFRAKYATLTAVWDAIRKPLSNNALAITQITNVEAGDLVLITLLLHESGQWIQSTYPITPVKDTPQGYGSALTYARRYSLAALIGVVADEDDDANAAEKKGDESKPAVKKANTNKPVVKAKKKVTPKEDDRPYYLKFRDIFAAQVETQGGKPVPAQGILGAAMGILDDLLGGERDARVTFISQLLGRPITTSNDLNTLEKNCFVAWLKPTKDEEAGWITGNINVAPTIELFNESLPPEAELELAAAANKDREAKK